jgi:hypothetical protein
MQTLPRYRCERYERIRVTFTADVTSFDNKSKNSASDEVAKACVGWTYGARRTLARKLEVHIRRCGLCR